MNNLKVSWKYELITEDGKVIWEQFECDDCIKLELGF
jgi:hypothetical protein